jgi:LPS export ABC transporter protein LptC
MTKRIHYLIFIQAALFSSCLFVLGCGNDTEKINAWTGSRVMVDEVRSVTSLFSQSGNMRAQLTAPLMLRYYSDTIITEFPNTLHVDFYDSLGQVESRLDARYGKYFENLNKVLLQKEVRVVNRSGDTLTTAELWWDQNAKLFFTDSTVRIIQKDKHIRGGKGMEATQDLNMVTIRYPTGTVIVGDDVMPR